MKRTTCHACQEMQAHGDDDPRGLAHTCKPQKPSTPSRRAPAAPPPARSTPGPVTDQLRAAMQAQGIGVTELARRLGRDHAHVSRTLSGTWAPSAEFLQACADVLGVELVVPEVRYRPGAGP